MVSIASVLATPAGTDVDASIASIDPDEASLYMLTSGSTSLPKAVIQTQRMLCSNQAMVAKAYPFLADEPPVLVDWAPWNHTASGNKVFNMAIYHGGTYYIDDGRPTADGIARTIRTLRSITNIEQVKKLVEQGELVIE